MVSLLGLDLASAEAITSITVAVGGVGLRRWPLHHQAPPADPGH